jgi:hypothetical protein
VAKARTDFQCSVFCSRLVVRHLMASPIPSRQGSFTSPPPASPRRTSGLGAGQNAEQRRARREQFRSFYGLKGGPEGVAEGEAVKAGDPLDIGELAQPCNNDVAEL